MGPPKKVTPEDRAAQAGAAKGTQQRAYNDAYNQAAAPPVATPAQGATPAPAPAQPAPRLNAEIAPSVLPPAAAVTTGRFNIPAPAPAAAGPSITPRIDANPAVAVGDDPMAAKAKAKLAGWKNAADMAQRATNRANFAKANNATPSGVGVVSAAPAIAPSGSPGNSSVPSLAAQKPGTAMLANRQAAGREASTAAALAAPVTAPGAPVASAPRPSPSLQASGGRPAPAVPTPLQTGFRKAAPPIGGPASMALPQERPKGVAKLRTPPVVPAALVAAAPKPAMSQPSMTTPEKSQGVADAKAKAQARQLQVIEETKAGNARASAFRKRESERKAERQKNVDAVVNSGATIPDWQRGTVLGKLRQTWQRATM